MSDWESTLSWKSQYYLGTADTNRIRTLLFLKAYNIPAISSIRQWNYVMTNLTDSGTKGRRCWVLQARGVTASACEGPGVKQFKQRSTLLTVYKYAWLVSTSSHFSEMKPKYTPYERRHLGHLGCTAVDQSRVSLSHQSLRFTPFP